MPSMDCARPTGWLWLLDPARRIPQAGGTQAEVSDEVDSAERVVYGAEQGLQNGG
jgi:hypothetical protein